MGWGRMLLLGNWGQQMDIEDQRKELQALRHQLARPSRSTDTGRLIALERENAELRLYVAAIVRYLAAKGSIDPSEFGVLVNEIDREDGRQDGRFEGKVL